LYQGCTARLTTAHLLLGDVRHLEDLTETTLLAVIAAGDEYTSSNNSVLRFSFEQLCIVRDTKEQLGRLSRWLAYVL
jgi:hypothetical protein